MANNTFRHSRPTYVQLPIDYNMSMRIEPRRGLHVHRQGEMECVEVAGYKCMAFTRSQASFCLWGEVWPLLRYGPLFACMGTVLGCVVI